MQESRSNLRSLGGKHIARILPVAIITCFPLIALSLHVQLAIYHRIVQYLSMQMLRSGCELVLRQHRFLLLLDSSCCRCGSCCWFLMVSACCWIFFFGCDFSGPVVGGVPCRKGDGSKVGGTSGFRCSSGYNAGRRCALSSSWQKGLYESGVPL